MCVTPPCGRYDKKENPDELLGREHTSPVCAIDLFIENQQITSARNARSRVASVLNAAK